MKEFILFMLLLFTACKPEAPVEVEQPRRVDTLNFGLFIDPDLLDSLRQTEDSIRVSEVQYHIINVFNHETKEVEERYESSF